MNYLKLYNKLADVQVSENAEMPVWQRLRLTFRIAKCSSAIQEEICKYIDTQEQPEYSLTIRFKDAKTKEIKETEVSCYDVQSKMHLQVIPALLYMDWLRREPEQAAFFVVRKDDLPSIPREQIRAHIDLDLLAKADKVRNEKLQHDWSKMESGK